jgi:hypothetical protein
LFCLRQSRNCTLQKLSSQLPPTFSKEVCATLDQQEFEGRRLTVNEAKPQEQRNGGFSRGGGVERQRRDARW